jgi:hypothetical protein
MRRGDPSPKSIEIFDIALTDNRANSLLVGLELLVQKPGSSPWKAIFILE